MECGRFFVGNCWNFSSFFWDDDTTVDDFLGAFWLGVQRKVFLCVNGGEKFFYSIQNLFLCVCVCLLRPCDSCRRPSATPTRMYDILRRVCWVGFVRDCLVIWRSVGSV